VAVGEPGFPVARKTEGVDAMEQRFTSRNCYSVAKDTAFRAALDTGKRELLT